MDQYYGAKRQLDRTTRISCPCQELHSLQNSGSLKPCLLETPSHLVFVVMGHSAQPWGKSSKTIGLPQAQIIRLASFLCYISPVVSCILGKMGFSGSTNMITFVISISHHQLPPRISNHSRKLQAFIRERYQGHFQQFLLIRRSFILSVLDLPNADLYRASLSQSCIIGSSRGTHFRSVRGASSHDSCIRMM